MFNPHENFIKRCFMLALKAQGMTSPNPLVGAVIVKDGLIISEGFHAQAGQAHAELDAIEKAQSDLTGATLYCNLEPCCHTDKRTPPCTEAIVRAGITEVIVSNLDPNPKVAGKGLKALEEAGIKTQSGICKAEGEIINEVFFCHIVNARPFVHLKWAQTLDGKLATKNYNSQWITGEPARQHVHQERNLYDAIMVGSRTATHDNPRLTVRINNQPEVCKKRIVLSHSGDIRSDLKLFNDEFAQQTLVLSGRSLPENFPVRHLLCPTEDEGLNLSKVLELLYSEGITSLYVEGGARLINSFIQHGLFDRLSCYIAPKLLGEGISAMGNNHPTNMDQAIRFESGVWTQLGTDILFESKRNLCLQDW